MRNQKNLGFGYGFGFGFFFLSSYVLLNETIKIDSDDNQCESTEK
jgi:hypothetical protein